MPDVGAASLALTQALGSFNSFLPPLTEIRKHTPTDVVFVKDVRSGEIAAVVVTMGVGAVMSSLTKDPTPAIVALVISVGLVGVYEWTLRQNRPEVTDAER